MESRPHGMSGPSGTGPEDAARSGKGAASAADAIDTQKLRNALGCFTTGITIVTARAPDGQVAGVTANSFCSVSLEPPLVLWCLSKSAPSQSVFVKATHFAIHILAEDQAHLSVRFCKPSKNKFAGLALSDGLGRAPLLDGVLALFECRSQHRYEGGDHYIIVGRVERYHHTDRPPLLFHTGGYRGLGRP